MAEKRLFLWALAMAAATWGIARFHPWGSAIPRDAAFGAFAGIAAQAWLPIAGVLVFAGLWWRRFPVQMQARPQSERFFQTLIAVWPIVVLLDCVSFGWIGERLFSAAIGEIVRNHLPRLSGHVTSAMWLGWFAGIISLIGCSAGLSWLIRRIASRWDAASGRSSFRTGVAVTLVIGLMNVPAMLDRDATWIRLQQHASRQPWGIAGWLDTEPQNPVELPSVSTAEVIVAAENRLKQLRWNVVGNLASETEATTFPDVLIVVVESLRPELIEPVTMPNVHGMAKRGVWMKQHHSGGNASSLGIFSLVSGMEAVWFYHAQARFSPAMNRLFRQAGYELGFFAGADDWDAFQMDAFINADAYDTFEIEMRDWLASDRRAIANAKAFLERTTDDASAFRAPRLAVLYLYSTHAPFDVDERFATDQPAASENYAIPFTPAMRPAIWNRYRNAARSIDDRIADLIADPNRITLLIGDHGESFLDDGTIGHGTRCSAAQIQTPAIMVAPGVAPRVVDDATSHADLLPTLLAAAGIKVTRPDCFDGVDVLSWGSDRGRVISVADYLREQVLLIPSKRPPRSVVRPFGWQCELSLRSGHAAVLGPVDEKGNPIGMSAPKAGGREANSGANWLNTWLQNVSRE